MYLLISLHLGSLVFTGMNPAEFIAGFAAGALIAGTCAYVAGQKKSLADERSRIVEGFVKDYFEWSPSGDLHLRKDVLERELQAADNEKYGIGAFCKKAILEYKEKVAEGGDEAEASKELLQKIKFAISISV